MEQILPILIAAIVFSFQAYANYKKEQEKARQRQQSKPKAPEERGSDEVIYEDVPVPAEYIPARPAPETTQSTSSSKPASNPYGEYQGTISAEEARQLVNRSHTATNQRPAPILERKLEITDLEEDEYDDNPSGNAGQPIDVKELDLRQAVIHSIILERPYS